MRITIIAYGTRGDVQPAVALGKALQAVGHELCVVASSNFAKWIRLHGLKPVAASVDIQAIMAGEHGLDWVEYGNNPIKQMQAMKRLITQHGRSMMRSSPRPKPMSIASRNASDAKPSRVIVSSR